MTPDNDEALGYPLLLAPLFHFLILRRTPGYALMQVDKNFDLCSNKSLEIRT